VRGRKIVKKGVNTIGFKNANADLNLGRQNARQNARQKPIKSARQEAPKSAGQTPLKSARQEAPKSAGQTPLKSAKQNSFITESYTEKNMAQDSKKVHIHAHPDKKEQVQMPKGLKVLMVYSAIVAFFYLLLIFLSDSTVFFGILIKGFFARFIFFILFILTFLIVYGITYKQKWCYKFSIFIYIISIVNSIFSIFFIGKINDSLVTSLYALIIPLFIITLLMNFLTLWYVYEKKLYFIDPTHIHKHSLADDVFVYTIYLFYFFVALFIIVLGSMIFISATNNVSYVMSVTAGMNVAEAEYYCESLTDPEAMDMCFISVVYNNRAENDISKLCNSVKLGYYKYTCLKLAEE
jgi:hypothetical protein